MFGKVYLPDHCFKLIYRFKFSEFPINLRPKYRLYKVGNFTLCNSSGYVKLLS